MAPTCPCLDGRFKVGQVNFVQRTFLNDGVSGVPSELGVVADSLAEWHDAVDGGRDIQERHTAAEGTLTVGL